MEGFTDRQKERLVRIIGLVLFALAAFLVVMTLNGLRTYGVIGRDVPPQATIAVSGEGEVFARPDIATFTFGVREEAPVVIDAQEKVTERVEQAITFLKEQGVEEKDIKTLSFTINPRYEFRSSRAEGRFIPEGRRELVGFEVSETLSVKVRDIENAGKLLGGLGEIGATNVSGLSFSVDDDEALVAEARGMAIADAKEKAGALAKSLGVRLVRVVSFNENNFFPFAREESFAVNAARDGAARVPIEIGESRISSSVSIVYEIR